MNGIAMAPGGMFGNGGFGGPQQHNQPAAMNGFAMAPGGMFGHGGYGGPQQQQHNQPAAMNGFAMAPGGMFGHGGFGGPQQQQQQQFNQPGMHGQGVIGGGGPAAQLHGAQAAVAAGQQQQQMIGQPNPPANNANWTHCADGTVTTEFLNSVVQNFQQEIRVPVTVRIVSVEPPCQTQSGMMVSNAVVTNGQGRRMVVSGWDDRAGTLATALVPGAVYTFHRLRSTVPYGQSDLWFRMNYGISSWHSPNQTVQQMGGAVPQNPQIGPQLGGGPLQHHQPNQNGAGPHAPQIFGGQAAAAGVVPQPQLNLNQNGAGPHAPQIFGGQAAAAGVVPQPQLNPNQNGAGAQFFGGQAAAAGVVPQLYPNQNGAVAQFFGGQTAAAGVVPQPHPQLNPNQNGAGAQFFGGQAAAAGGVVPQPHPQLHPNQNGAGAHAPPLQQFFGGQAAAAAAVVVPPAGAIIGPQQVGADAIAPQQVGAGAIAPQQVNLDFLDEENDAAVEQPQPSPPRPTVAPRRRRRDLPSSSNAPLAISSDEEGELDGGRPQRQAALPVRANAEMT